VSERLQHCLRSNWQVTYAGSTSGEDRVPNRGRDRGRRRLAKPNWYFHARNKLDFDVGYATHAQQCIFAHGFDRFARRLSTSLEVFSLRLPDAASPVGQAGRFGSSVILAAFSANTTVFD
jgi:hypothetical protein